MALGTSCTRDSWDLQAFENMIVVTTGISMITAYGFSQGQAGLLYTPYFPAISPAAIVYSV
jgi:hypothetical protein